MTHIMTMKSPFLPWMHTFSRQPINRRETYLHRMRQQENETVDGQTQKTRSEL